MRIKVLVIPIVVILIVAGAVAAFKMKARASSELKIYWLIPDGLRSEPEVFKIFEWAQNGELPNIKKLMERGAHGYSIPVFPSHTPVNYATLLTGTNPATHGVADGPMHVEGTPLNQVAVGGFRSVARKIPAVWSLFEDQGMKVAVLSTPGSTPNELQRGLVVRGRWGGVGHDVHAINFEVNRDLSSGTPARKMFFTGPELTRAVKFENAATQTFVMSAWGAKIDARLEQGRVTITAANRSVSLSAGEWSDWLPVEAGPQDLRFSSSLKVHVSAADQHSARVRVLFDNLNRTVVFPPEAAESLNRSTGPMVDFVDNFPPQLIYYPEDKKTFLDEMGFSFDWHTRVIGNILRDEKPHAVIHGIYNPNQMLTSRWWLGYTDPKGKDYALASEDQRAAAWKDVKEMYRAVDAMVGQILEHAGDDTVIILSSDHGAIPLKRWVNLNNLFAKQGWLKTKVGAGTGELEIDWRNSQVVYLQMDGVFIRPDGLDGPWKRGQGRAYEELRAKVVQVLESLKDENGMKPVDKIVRWEEAPQKFNLPTDRVGDLVIANSEGFGWSEDLNKEMAIFSDPLIAGYKQAVIPETSKGMWTPFVIAGPGIKKGFRLEQPIAHVDQLPTILKSLGMTNPQRMDGRVLQEVFKE